MHASPQKAHRFSTAEIILLIAVALLLCATGYSAWRALHKTTPARTTTSANQDTYTVGMVTFRHASQIPSSVRQEILAKVASPLLYYEKNDLKTDPGGVVIDLGLAPDNHTRSAIYGYNLTETHPAQSGATFGFMFGQDGTIDYWLPQLCDDGGCKPYPADFKAAYPDTYQAYQKAQNATK